MEDAVGIGIGLCAGLIGLFFAIVQLAGMWKTFAKAGKPGWAVLIPLYNVVVFVQIAGRPLWWLLLFFVPLVNLIVGIVLNFDIAKRFGGGVGLGLLLAFIPIVGFSITGFGDVTYSADPA